MATRGPILTDPVLEDVLHADARLRSPAEASLADLVYFDNDGRGFEERGFSNGVRHWYASDLMVMLGYASMAAFDEAIDKAIGTCVTLAIPVLENFEQCRRTVDGRTVPDYKLTRFACYLIAINGDVAKPQVAAAQAYFARLAEAASSYVQSMPELERVRIREDVSDRERSLAGTAKRAGVSIYSFFHNAGYRGMYNVDHQRLRTMKGMRDPGRSLLDFMSKRELAANLFRLTETQARLQAEKVQGQAPAEDVAFAVGRKVREMMIENTGTRPELIPLGSDIRRVKKGLKRAHRDLSKLDAPKPRKRRAD